MARIPLNAHRLIEKLTECFDREKEIGSGEEMMVTNLLNSTAFWTKVYKESYHSDNNVEVESKSNEDEINDIKIATALQNK